ncbi:MAG: transferase [Ginsengibacter sp.]
MEKIAIFGAGGFGREVKMLIDQINMQKPIFEFIGYFDDGIQKGVSINNHPVLGGLLEAQNWSDGKLNLVVAVAEPKTKKKIVDSIENEHIAFPSLIHPGVLIGADEVNIGFGCIICAGTIITVNIDIGNYVILNLSCTVGHDTKIGDYCSFMPSVNIS